MTDNIITKNDTNEIYPHLVPLTDKDIQIKQLSGNYNDIIQFLKSYLIYKYEGIKLNCTDTLYIQLLDYVGQYNDNLMKIISTSGILNKTAILQPPIYVNDCGEIINGAVYE